MFKEKYHIHFSDVHFTVNSSVNIMLNEHWNQGSSNRYTTPSAVTPQFVVLTTHGATSVDKAVKATTLCFQWEKEKPSVTGGLPSQSVSTWCPYLEETAFIHKYKIDVPLVVIMVVLSIRCHAVSKIKSDDTPDTCRGAASKLVTWKFGQNSKFGFHNMKLQTITFGMAPNTVLRT